MSTAANRESEASKAARKAEDALNTLQANLESANQQVAVSRSECKHIEETLREEIKTLKETHSNQLKEERKSCRQQESEIAQLKKEVTEASEMFAKEQAALKKTRCDRLLFVVLFSFCCCSDCN